MTFRTIRHSTSAHSGPAAENDRLSLADALSLSRIGLAGALWLVDPAPGPMLALMGVAALSDVLDGHLARRARQGAPAPPGGGRGAWLDPLCDKVFVVSLIARVTVALAVPPWLIALIGARELLLFASLAAHTALRGKNSRRVEYTASGPGKATTALQFVTLGLLVWKGQVTTPAVVAAATAAFVGLLATLGYAVRSRVRSTGRPSQTIRIVQPADSRRGAQADRLWGLSQRDEP